MSQENVQAVRRMLVSISDRDYDTAIREFRSDAQWHNTGAFPGPIICSGPSEIKAFWKSLFEDFDSNQMEIEKTAETGNTVTVALHSQGRGRTSGAPVDIRWAIGVRFEGDKIIGVNVYGDYGRALEAVGRSEQGAHADS
jgi:ketosteroid isomerase-like protein